MRIPPQCAAMTKREVCAFQTPWQLRFHGTELHGVGARLEDRQNAPVGPHFAAQPIDRGADGGGVMGKVVINRDGTVRALYLTAHFHASLHIFKATQGASCMFGRNADMRCAGNGGQRIELVVHAAESPHHMRNRLALVQHIELVRLANGCEITDGRAKTAHLTPATGMQHARQAFLQPIDDYASRSMRASPRNRANQMVKLTLDGGQIVEDVGMIKLEVIQDGRARAVVHELAALVKECSVVFVGFNHKDRLPAKTRRDAEIHWHATDQKARLQTRTLQNPGHHGGGRGLAMGAGYSNHMPALQHMFGQPLRSTGIGQSGVQNRFNQGELRTAIGQTCAADHVADHEHIRRQCQLIGSEAFNQVNPKGPQLVAHGRVDAAVATCDFVTGFARERSQATHESAANAKNMNVHKEILGRHPGTHAGQNAGMDTLKMEIAAVAARIVVEEGQEYGPAKRRAVKQMGLAGRTALPDNDAVEDAVIEYIALFCGETQAGELLALRRLAMVWMQRMAEFRPHLGGSVWHGSATRRSDIYIQLFCDDCKSAEIALIDHGIKYLARSMTGFHGEAVEALSLNAFCPELNDMMAIHLLVYDRDDVRGALRPDSKGRTPRGDLAALARLLHDRPL